MNRCHSSRGATVEVVEQRLDGGPSSELGGCGDGRERWVTIAASGMSSSPTTLSSSGTRTPSAASRLRIPTATRCRPGRSLAPSATETRSRPIPRRGRRHRGFSQARLVAAEKVYKSVGQSGARRSPRWYHMPYMVKTTVHLDERDAAALRRIAAETGHSRGIRPPGVEPPRTRRRACAARRPRGDPRRPGFGTGGVEAGPGVVRPPPRPGARTRARWRHPRHRHPGRWRAQTDL